MLRHAVVPVAVVVDLVIWDGAVTTRHGATIPVWLPPVLIVVCVIPLLWRFRAPVTATAPSWVLGCAAVVVPDWQPFAGLLVAVHAVALVRNRRVSVPVALSCVVPFGIDSVDSAAHTRPDGFLAALAVFVVFWVLVTSVAWGFGRWSHRAAERGAVQTAAALRAERLRLARDVHDAIAGNLTAMMVHATVASERLGPEHEEVRASLATIGRAGHRVMEELACMLALLRAADGADVEAAGRPGVADLARLVESCCRDHGLGVALATRGLVRDLDPTVDHVIYRVVAEGLANAAKHGDRTASCEVRLEYAPTRVLVEVENGRDAAAPESRWSFGWGLTGLREQVATTGGTLSATAAGAVFVLRAELPAFAPAATRLAVSPDVVPAPRGAIRPAVEA